VRTNRSTLRSGILLLTLCALSLTACDRGKHPAQEIRCAPEFTLIDEGRSVDLAQLRGRTVVLNFWATWCVPCVAELPSLLALQHRFPQIVVLAISQDDDAAVYRQFLVDNHVDLLTLRDPSARIPQIYGTVRIPETYIIDRKGILRRKFVNAQDWTSPEIVDYLGKL
jgi:cytochrome c biogenesis protein CcmG/thiol:disulfide interchange protein DsbE